MSLFSLKPPPTLTQCLGSDRQSQRRETHRSYFLLDLFTDLFHKDFFPLIRISCIYLVPNTLGMQPTGRTFDLSTSELPQWLNVKWIVKINMLVFFIALFYIFSKRFIFQVTMIDTIATQIECREHIARDTSWPMQTATSTNIYTVVVHGRTATGCSDEWMNFH